MARIAVIGAGYVGITSAAGLASLGHDVVCADIDEARIAALNDARVPIFEDGLTKLVRQGLDAGRLEFVIGATTASAASDFHFLCLPTPPGGDGAADLSFIMDVAREIAAHLPSGSVVVNKSTVPVGTAALVAEAISRPDVSVVSNPEFLREGSALADFLNPDRIVVGGDDPVATERVAELYAKLSAPIQQTDAKSSELIKYASNAYLATKLTFVNEIAEVCEQLGADIHEVMHGMGLDKRIGTSYLSPGPGWGGSCFPKDTEALVHIAASVDVEFDFLRNVIELNHRHIERIAAKVKKFVGGDLAGRRVGAWGLTFKAGTDDLRDSPALAVLRLLVEEGALVTAYDPTVAEHNDALPDVVVANSPIAAATGCDALVLLTEWPEFLEVPLTEVAAVMAKPNIVDARNALDRDQLDAHGFTHVGVGR